MKKKNKNSCFPQLKSYFRTFQLSIQAKIAEILKKDEKANVIAPKTHAFGRSLSPASQYRKRLEFSNPDPSRFPKEIYSGEHLFKGIECLK